MNQTRHGVSHGCLEFRTQRVFGIACLEKVSISYGNLLLFRINIFKNRSFSWGQGVVQSEPNPLWSIPWLLRV